jgi:hypothetical protein
MKKAGIGLAVGVILVAAMWWFGVRAVTTDIKKTRRNIKKLKQQQQANANLKKRSEDILQSCFEKRSELKYLLENKMVPQKAPMLWLDPRLRPMISNSGLTFTTIGNVSTREVDSGHPDGKKLLEEVITTTRMSGTYHQLAHLLIDFETTFPYAYLEKLSISGGGTRMDAETPEEERVLSVNLGYTFLRFTEEGFPQEEIETLDQQLPLSASNNTKPEVRKSYEAFGRSTK